MKLTDLLLIALHIVLAFVIYYVPVAAKLYATGLIAFVFFISFTARDPKVLLYTSAYVVGAEVFTRMTKGLFFYESHKYLIMILALAYIFRRGLKKTSFIFALYLVLLVPGILKTLFIEANDPSYLIESIRKTILFNLAGPLALGLAAMAWVKEELSLEEFKRLNFWMLLPVILMVTYMILQTPSLGDIIFTTSSNKALSGGFGPNQTATILGLGMFASLVLLLTEKNIISKLIYFFLLSIITYRAFLTFSRGGTITGIIIILIFIYVSWRSEFRFMKTKSFIGIAIASLIISFSFYIAMEITGGLILNRYLGKNRLGEQKDITSGRIIIFLTEMEIFLENPFLGTGIGRAKIERKKYLGVAIATHNEISRLLSEHGLFGILALLVLFFAPFLTGAYRKNNLFFYPYFAFWLLTISHSSMRLAASAALYGFALLNLYFYDNSDM